MEKNTNLVWLDLEMSGLQIEHDKILEIAAIITDTELNIIAESDSIAIKQPDDILENMNEWCMKAHGSSGLVKRVKASNISEQKAEQLILEFIQPFVLKEQSPLCGNSIWQDRKFLSKFMPNLESYFHYRLLDVSTLKILAHHWYPDASKSLNKAGKHLALDDIKDSIAELQHYRNQIFK